MSAQPPSLAIIGAGPAGLATAKFSLDADLRPTVFEQSAAVGGQWHSGAAHSGVWPSMHTNTSHLLTCFSDLPHEAGTPVFPSNQQVRAYLERYATRFGVSPHVRLQTRVVGVARQPDGRWLVHSTTPGGVHVYETFDQLVVASGRYHRPAVPAVPGRSEFAGVGGVVHAFDYKGVEAYRGRRVVVVGNSISALEISSDLAMGGAARVISAFRQPRYILQKLLAGRPTDCVLFTRFAHLAGRALPLDAALEGLRQQILRTCGHPAQYGAPAPADSLLEAKVSQCQHYLALVAEGRIEPRREVNALTAGEAVFADGTREEIDAVIFATGYDLSLPFLDEETQRVLGADRDGLDLYRHTFHPELPGLAFAGLFAQVGPYFPVLELQARWIAMVAAGARALPDCETMQAELDGAAQVRRVNPTVVFHDMAMLFAESAGVLPDVASRPQLAKALLFGPLAPVQFRLDGPGRLPEAEARFAAEAASFGCIESPDFDEPQRQGLAMLAAAFDDQPWLAALAGAGAPAQAGQPAGR